MKPKRRRWLFRNLRELRLRIETERALDELPANLTDSETCILIDVAKHFGLTDLEARDIVGWENYDRVAGPLHLTLLQAMGVHAVQLTGDDLAELLTDTEVRR